MHSLSRMLHCRCSFRSCLVCYMFLHLVHLIMSEELDLNIYNLHEPESLKTGEVAIANLLIRKHVTSYWLAELFTEGCDMNFKEQLFLTILLFR